MKYIFLALAFVFFGGYTVHASDITATGVSLLDADGIITTSYIALPAKVSGNVGDLAVTDLGIDGNSEIIVSSNSGTAPLVYVYGQDGVLATSFLAYAPTYGNGVRLATGDVDGDGQSEIVTGTGFGGGPQIRIFDGKGAIKDGGFFAYDQKSRGGVFVTVRDLDGDGKAEIITGAGIGTEPKVKIFSGSGELISEFIAFDLADLSGVTVGTADIDGDGNAEILVGRASSNPSELKAFSPNGLLKKTISLDEYLFSDGITANGADCNADGREDLLISSNGVETNLLCLSRDGTLIRTFEMFPKDYAGTAKAVWAKLSANTSESLIFTPSIAHRSGTLALAQEIRVSLDEQRLYAYEYGRLVKTFLVSTGVNRYPTPKGDYTVQQKIPIKDYKWSYGINHPDNYNLPNVKYNLQFRPKFYLHYAYWHNNFGHRMSHGCINMPLAESEWIYNWAYVGVTVIVE